MRLVYSRLARDQLAGIREYIAADNKKAAEVHLQEIRRKLELLLDFPYLGKVNTTFNKAEIRDFVVLGYKVIYQIKAEVIEVLAIYRYLDLDESSLDL